MAGQPDLASILQTLSAHTPQSYAAAQYEQQRRFHQGPIQRDVSINPGQSSTSNWQAGPSIPSDWQVEGEGSSSTYTFQTPYLEPRPSNLAQNHSDSESLINTKLQPNGTLVRNTKVADTSTNGPPDPAAITTYPAALRYITIHLMPQPQFTLHIRHLITTQHTHERQWFTGREKLIKQIRSRDESRARLDAVLASVGGKSSGISILSSGNHALNGNGKDSPRADHMTEEEELRNYDGKIWKAQNDMVRDAERELGRLGVPFFCDRDITTQGIQGKDQAELRQKVVALLEDLCSTETS